MFASVVIDSLEFARNGRRLQGTVAVAALKRLADSLFDTMGDLQFEVNGGHDAEHRPCLTLKVEGAINLRCQRCLGSLAYPVATGSSLLVLTAQTGGSDAENVGLADLDGVAADPHTDVWALVEDEVLLAIPISARHPEGICGAAVAATLDQRASPFAVLGKLKQQRAGN